MREREAKTAEQPAHAAPARSPAPAAYAEALTIGSTAGNVALGRILSRQSEPAPAEVIMAAGIPDALRRHRENVALVEAAVASLARGETAAAGGAARARNTAEVLRSDRVEVRVLTPTHDAVERAIRQGRASVGSGRRAYFGNDRRLGQPPADYDPPYASRRGILVSDPPEVTDAERVGHEIRLYDPTFRGMTYVRDFILLHEVQHLLDHHEDEVVRPGGTTVAARDARSGYAAWAEYKTEFRAYWVSGEFESRSSDDDRGASRPFHNPRQRAIAERILRGYEDIRHHYEQHTPVTTEGTFDAAVHAYAEPEGINLVNSARIDAFYTVLGRVMPAHQDPAAPPLRDLIAAARAFDATDRAYVGSGSAWRLQNSIGGRCRGAALTAVASALGAAPDAAWVRRAASAPEWRG